MSRHPKTKATFTVEGLSWERLAANMAQLGKTQPDNVAVTILVDGLPVFGGVLASVVHAYPSSPPHAALSGGVVKIEAIEWCEAEEPQQRDRPAPTSIPSDGSGGPRGGGAAGPN